MPPEVKGEMRGQQQQYAREDGRVGYQIMAGSRMHRTEVIDGRLGFF